MSDGAPGRDVAGGTGRERRRILVAEDNEAHRMVLRRIMREVERESSVSLDLDFVGDGAMLLAFLRAPAPADGSARRQPDVILLDLHMPRVSGLEALRQLSEDEQLRSIPVIVLSSSDQAHHIDQAYANGANAYLVKLGDHAALADQMRRFATFWLETALLPRRGPSA